MDARRMRYLHSGWAGYHDIKLLGGGEEESSDETEIYG